VCNNFLGAFLSGLASIASVVGPPLVGALNGYLNKGSENSNQEALLRQIEMQKQTNMALMSMTHQPAQVIEVVKSPGVIERRANKDKKKKDKSPKLKVRTRAEAERKYGKQSPGQVFNPPHIGPRTNIPWGVPAITNQRPRRNPKAIKEQEYDQYLNWRRAHGYKT